MPAAARRACIAFLLALAWACDGGKAKAPAPAPEPETAPFTMVDRGPDCGIDEPVRSGTPEQRFIVEVKSTGVGLIDYDGDGRQDIVVTSGSTIERAIAGKPGFGTRLYRNLGGFRFEDVTAAAGIPPTGWASAPIVADFDGDGLSDLLITQFGEEILLHNAGGRFEDWTARSGLAGDDRWTTSAVFHDLDGDGDLDLYLCNYLRFPLQDPPLHGKPGFSCRWKEFEVMCGPKGLQPEADRCFRNDGDGHFTDVTEAWGFAVGEAGFALGVVAGDFDGDGSPDLYVANDGMANRLYQRRADGRFEDGGYFAGLALSEGGAPQAGMGVDAADLNDDGIDDIVCTNFSGEENDVYLSQDGGSAWSESATLSGTALAGFNTLGWGVGLRDFDLDGRPDLFVANGHVYPQAAQAGTGTDYPQWNLLYLGRENGRFVQVPRESMPALMVKKVSRGAAFGDLDDDGDVDVVVVNLNDRLSIIENRLDRARADRHFVGLRLDGGAPNRDAIGARVTIESAGRKRHLEVRRQSSFQASSDPRLVFGLGALADPREVTVRWPDGTRERFEVAADRYQTLVRGKGRSP